MSTVYLPTEPQLDYVRGLQRRHKLSDDALDIYCTRAYGVTLSEMTRFQVGQLINSMKEWKGIPAEVQRALGQLDLFGNEA